MPSTVSFTVRRPTPVSRPSSSGPESDGQFKVPALPRHLASASSSATGSPLAGSPRRFGSRDDSDDDGETGIVFANGSDADDDGHRTDSSDEGHILSSSKLQSGQRFYQKKKQGFTPEEPLVIPSKPNPDWREAARKRRAACSRTTPYTSRATPSFVPDSARVTTGADGSVGGLGTKDTINSGPQLSGLQLKKKVKIEDEEDDDAKMEVVSAEVTVKVVEETEDQKALRAILAGEDGSAPAVDIIPVPPLSEADALKQDVEDLPEVASAEDYERVPIADFGAAMLRGMGWSDGAVASKGDKRRKNGLTGLYLPQARPALLGIGAKEQEPDDDGSGKKKRKGPDMRYIPVARTESGRGEGGSSRSGTVSRRGSPSRGERDDRGADRERSAYDDRERRRERDRGRDRDDESRRGTRDYDRSASDRKDRRDRDRDRDRDRGGSDAYRNREGGGKGRECDRRDGVDDRDKRDRRGDR